MLSRKVNYFGISRATTGSSFEAESQSLDVFKAAFIFGEFIDCKLELTIVGLGPIGKRTGSATSG